MIEKTLEKIVDELAKEEEHDNLWWIAQTLHYYTDVSPETIYMALVTRIKEKRE